MKKKITQNGSNKWKFIKYPVSLSEHYSSKYNKHIYIFGDHHEEKIKCPSKSNSDNTTDIIQFFDSILTLKSRENKLKNLDFFLEMSYKHKNSNSIKENYRGYYGSFVNYLRSNIIPKKTSGEYNHTRVHFSDIRNSIPHLNNLIKLQLVFELILSNKDADIPIQECKEISAITDNLIKSDFFNEITDIEQYLDKIMNLTKIDKQLSSTEYPDVADLILSDNFSNILLSLRSHFKPSLIQNFLNMYRGNAKLNSINKDLLSNIRIAIDKLLFNLAKITDIYLIARMFRKFKKVTGTVSEPPTNIIVYVGEYHADNCRKFLSRLGFSEKIVTSLDKDKDYQCINVDKFHQPFFQQRELIPHKVYL